MLSLTSDEIFEKLIETATKLISTDLVNDQDNSRYSVTVKDPKTKKDYCDLNCELAMKDAKELILMAMCATEETEDEWTAIEEEIRNKSIEPMESSEIENGEVASEVEVMGPPGGRKGADGGRKCVSSKSSSKTSVSSKRSKRR